MIYLKLFWEFLKIGAFTFGGGYAMIPLIQQVIIKYNWITEQQMIDFMAVSESTPGSLAVNISTYIGMKTAGIGGALTATFGVVLPSFIITLLISGCYKKFQNNNIVRGAMAGLQPTIIALIAASLLSIAGNVFDMKNLFTGNNLISMATVLIAGYLCYRKKHPIMVIGISALVGMLLGWAS